MTDPKPVAELVTAPPDLTERPTPSPPAILADFKAKRQNLPNVTVRDLMLQLLAAEQFRRFEQGMNVIMDRFAEGDWNAINYVTAQMNGQQQMKLAKTEKVIEQLPDPADMTKRIRGT